MDQRAFGAVTAVSGCLIAVLAFLPWFDFGSFSVSGIKLPGITGEALVVVGILVAVIGLASTKLIAPLLLLIAALSGIVGFALCTEQLFTYWQAGNCGAFTGDAPTADFICRGYSDITWNVDGSPTEVLWAATGLSAFVSLLAGWRLFQSPVRTKAEPPPDASEAWA